MFNFRKLRLFSCQRLSGMYIKRLVNSRVRFVSAPPPDINTKASLPAFFSRRVQHSVWVVLVAKRMEHHESYWTIYITFLSSFHVSFSSEPKLAENTERIGNTSGRKGGCLPFDIQSDLVYLNSVVPIKMCSDCETCGLLKHFK